MTGDLSWSSTAAFSFQQQCIVFLGRNISLWTPDPNTGDLIPPLDIDGNICPNACSGKGKCDLGRSLLFNHIIICLSSFVLFIFIT